MTKRTKFMIVMILIIVAIVSIACTLVINARNIAKKAAEENYTILSLQRADIQRNFNRIYRYENFSISSNETGYTVTLHAPTHSIKMECYFDKGLNYIDSNYVVPSIIDCYIYIIILLIVIGITFIGIVIWNSKKLLY